MASKKGRPQKNNNNIIINDISVEYLSLDVSDLNVTPVQLLNVIKYYKT